MIAFCSYNFCEDGNSLDPTPTNVQNITSTEIENAIFTDMYSTKDVSSPYSTVVPTEWDLNTIMLATFNGNLDAGNIDFVLSEVSSVRIKKRKKGDFNWMTIYEHTINVIEDLNFSIQDYLAIQNTEYEYAWVPVLSGVEGNYITASVLSTFNGVFVTDNDSIYKFIANVGYGATNQNQKIQAFEPFRQQYPVFVSNAKTNYKTGSMSARLIGNYETTQMFDREEMVQEKEAVLKFLTNKKAKFIKDWNGNANLVMVVGAPNVDYDNNWGMGMQNIGFNWMAVGDYTNSKTLQKVGYIPIVEGG